MSGVDHFGQAERRATLGAIKLVGTDRDHDQRDAQAECLLRAVEPAVGYEQVATGEQRCLRHVGFDVDVRWLGAEARRIVASTAGQDEFDVFAAQATKDCLEQTRRLVGIGRPQTREHERTTLQPVDPRRQRFV